MDDVVVASSSSSAQLKNRPRSKGTQRKQLWQTDETDADFASPIAKLLQLRRTFTRTVDPFKPIGDSRGLSGYDDDGVPVHVYWDGDDKKSSAAGQVKVTTDDAILNDVNDKTALASSPCTVDTEEESQRSENDVEPMEVVEDPAKKNEEDDSSCGVQFTPPLKYSDMKASPRSSLPSPKSPRATRKSPKPSTPSPIEMKSPKSPATSLIQKAISPKSPAASPIQKANSPTEKSQKEKSQSPATSPIVESKRRTEQIMTAMASPTEPDVSPVVSPISSPTKSPKTETLSPKSSILKLMKTDSATPPKHIVADVTNDESVESTPTTTTQQPTTDTPTQLSKISNKSKSKSSSRIPTTTGSPNKPLSAQDDFYKKPFEFGWRRELVWRANMETAKEKADVYFITQAGKKLRTRNEIMPYLTDGLLTIEHFCFSREPLGASAEFETVRNAKPSSRSLMAQSTPQTPTTTVPMGKRVSKPKGPKGASPPPEGWTPTRALKVNNAALLSTAAANRYTGSLSQAVTPTTKRDSSAEVTKKAKTKKIPKNLENSNNAPGDGSPATSTSTSTGNVSKKKRSRSISSNTSMNERPSKVAATEANGVAAVRGDTLMTNNNNNKHAATHEPCTNKCLKGGGQMPQLKCVKCLCLYHHECVGLTRQDCEYRTLNQPAGKDYMCEACQPPTEKKDSKKRSPNDGGSTISNKRAHVKPSTKRTTTPETEKVVSYPAVDRFTQELAVIKGNRYVILRQPINRDESKTKQNRLRKLKEDSNRKLAPLSLDADYERQTIAAARLAVEKATKEAHSRMFSDASYVFNALVIIFKYLKVHERPSAARVCKQWNAASKDPSLWTVVMLKNSKVNNWGGFAANLRARQTRHLDMRKMLPPTTRSDEMWHDFSTNIGKATSLESIDLCRCPAKVVESLLQTNSNLRVLNALTITDYELNVSNVDGLPLLREFRLRTVEQALFTCSLAPIIQLKFLEHLSLTGLERMSFEDFEIINKGPILWRSLELGDFSYFDEAMAANILSNMPLLERLRLENCQEAQCDTLKVLNVCGGLKKLCQLELVNFDIKPGFDEKLQQCANITKLLIIPTYLSQSATTNHIVLSAVKRAAGTLKVFTWGVTQELLRVTALYVGQCDESMRKEQYMFNECIPVLKPHGTRLHCLDDDDDVVDDDAKKDDTTDGQKADDEAAENPSLPQIEILPLEKVEAILEQSLPNTKFTIVKMPYAMTWKQHLVE